MSRFFLRYAATLLFAGVLGSCGGGDGDGDGAAAPTSPPSNGSLIDFAISGLAYSTATGSGTTNATGGFSYRCASVCETVTFRLGGITFGMATAGASLSLREFQGGLENGLLSEATIRRAQLLVALDADGDAGNGISLPAELATALANRSLDFNAASFEADLASLVDYLRGDNRLAASYRSGLQIPARAVARAIAEQAEAAARGVLVESPTVTSLPVNEIRKYVLRVPDSLLVPYTGNSTSLKSSFPRGLRPAVGAGITVTAGSTAGNVQLRSVTSRGIAVSAPRYFDGVTVRSADVLLGSDTNGLPSLGAIALSQVGADLQSVTPLKTADGAAFSGRPTPTDASGSDGARNLDETLQPRSPEFDQRGLDPAGVVEGDSGSLWICDRRGPFLVQVDTQGRTLQRLGPAGSAGALPDVTRRLPAILEFRQPGLGCGGVALRTNSGEVAFSVGAALNVGGRTATTARLIRLVTLNPRTGTVRQFGLPIRSNEFALRVLDLESISEDRLLALLRYRDGGASGAYRWEIRIVDLAGASELSSKSLTSGPSAGLALEYGSAADLESSGVTLATTTMLLELGALGWIAENAEGLARINAQTLVVIGQANGGVTSRIRGGDPALGVAEHQVDRNGLITPRAPGSSSPATFELPPAPVESRQTVIWTLQLRTPVPGA